MTSDTVESQLNSKHQIVFILHKIKKVFFTFKLSCKSTKAPSLSSFVIVTSRIKVTEMLGKLADTQPGVSLRHKERKIEKTWIDNYQNTLPIQKNKNKNNHYLDLN